MSAEQMKKDKGLAAVSDVEYLPALMTPLLDVVVQEVQKVKQRYFEKNRREIRRAVLTGGGILPPGIKDYIGKELGIETVLGNPFQRISYDSGLEPVVRDIGNILSVSLGIALREF
jgi:type IV pilus assembly protein PilM